MFGFAQKIGMTRIFIDGKHTPVTVLQFPENVVLLTKTQEKDGYKSVQIGVGTKKGTKATRGHALKHSAEGKAPEGKSFLHIAEFKSSQFVSAELDSDKKTITVEDFSTGDNLKVTGKTTGRGFTGAVKRYGFAGQPASHGHDHERAVGSIGQRWPQRVIPGTRMAGHQGDEQRTLNTKIVAIDAEKNLLFVYGSVPGTNSHFVRIQKVNA